MSVEHSKEEILSVLREIPQISVATFKGPKIRTRIMHFVNDGEFNIYLASLKGDPKTVQITQNPSISLLALKYEGDFPAATEVEITGWAEIVPDEDARSKWFKEETSKSPIVKYMVETGNTDKLDLIRVRPEVVKYRVAGEVVQGVPPTVLEFPENRRYEDDSAILRRKIKSWVTEVRLPFLTASVIPVLLGTAIAGATAGVFNPLFFALALLGGVSLHLGANVLNDYFDHRSGTDDLNTEFVRPFSGGSRVIQLGLLTPLEVMIGGVFFLLLGAAIGVFFVWVSGWFILALMLIGLVSAFFYTAPPLNLASRGIGEVFIGLNFGYLMTIGAYYIQTQTISLEPLVAATPVALLIAAVLYINEFPDYAADKAAGKWHLVVRLGRSRAALGYLALITATYVSILLAVALQVMPVYTLIGLLTLPLSVKAVRYTLAYHSQTPDLIPANAATINVHLLTGVMLTAGYVLAMLPSNQLLITTILTVSTGLLVTRIYRQLGKAGRVAADVRQVVSSNVNRPQLLKQP
ncbi:MAG: 1,4-dihydroxy-2-naphthoate octaprenyltransferase [Nitrososphaerales archaeon]